MNLLTAFFFQVLLTSGSPIPPGSSGGVMSETSHGVMLAEAEKSPLPGLSPFASTPSEAKGSPGGGNTSRKSVNSKPSASGVPEDVEALRVETELRQVEKNPRARARFFSQIQEVIRRVRMGEPIPSRLRMTNLNVFSPAAPNAPKPTAAALGLRAPADESLPSNAWSRTRDEPALSPALTIPSNPSTAPSPQTPSSVTWVSPDGDALNASTISRLLYWARVNGCPPDLALAEAWQESRVNPRAGRGGAGEIGMMQILPERARLEGVDARRLRDPDVNMWLGTKLLARYYRQEGSTQGAAKMYVGGPGVFQKHYAASVEEYINWYAASVQDADSYFSRYFQASP